MAIEKNSLHSFTKKRGNLEKSQKIQKIEKSATNEDKQILNGQHDY